MNEAEMEEPGGMTWNIMLIAASYFTNSVAGQAYLVIETMPH
jgi:hypothetical protein